MSRTFEEIMRFTRNISSEPSLGDEEARLLYECCIQVIPESIVVEVGCQLGRSSTLIAQIAQDIGFHPIHIDPYTQQAEMARGWIDNMMNAQGDEHAFSALYMRTEQAYWILDRLAPFSLAYIDGDHEYPGVMTDLKLIATRIHTGGFLLAHDYRCNSFPGVYRALSEFIDDKWEMVGYETTMGAWKRR